MARKKRRRKRVYREGPRDGWEDAAREKKRPDLAGMIRTDEELTLDLARSVAKVRARLATTSVEHLDGIDESLTLLRDVVGEGDPRDGRLAATDLLRHFREVSKAEDKHLHLHAAPDPKSVEVVEVIEQNDPDVAAFLRRLASEHEGTNGNGTD